MRSEICRLYTPRFMKGRSVDPLFSLPKATSDRPVVALNILKFVRRYKDTIKRKHILATSFFNLIVGHNKFCGQEWCRTGSSCRDPSQSRLGFDLPAYSSAAQWKAPSFRAWSPTGYTIARSVCCLSCCSPCSVSVRLV